jgi:hypothetical protein
VVDEAEELMTIFAIVPFTYVAKNLTLPKGTKIYFDYYLADNAMQVKATYGWKMLKREIRVGTWFPQGVPVETIAFMELTQDVGGWEDISANDRIVYRVEKKLKGLTRDDPEHPDFKSGA